MELWREANYAFKEESNGRIFGNSTFAGFIRGSSEAKAENEINPDAGNDPDDSSRTMTEPDEEEGRPPVTSRSTQPNRTLCTFVLISGGSPRLFVYDVF